MIAKKEMVIETWPSGLTTFSGGTRDEVKLSRPWQNDITIDRENCPFCKGLPKEQIFKMNQFGIVVIGKGQEPVGFWPGKSIEGRGNALEDRCGSYGILRAYRESQNDTIERL